MTSDLQVCDYDYDYASVLNAALENAAMTHASHASSRRLERSARDAGFTLVELLVVLGILALLATVAAPQVIRYLGKARTDTARVQVNAIASALELYAIDNGGYPSQQTGLGALMQAPVSTPRWAGPYLKKADGLIDPWGRPYQYRLANSQFQVFTLGRDNTPGGTGEDQDIAN